MKLKRSNTRKKYKNKEKSLWVKPNGRKIFDYKYKSKILIKNEFSHRLIAFNLTIIILLPILYNIYSIYIILYLI